MCTNLFFLVYFYKGDYDKAIDYLQGNLSIRKEYELDEFPYLTYLLLAYKKMGKNMMLIH